LRDFIIDVNIYLLPAPMGLFRFRRGMFGIRRSRLETVKNHKKISGNRNQLSYAAC